MPVSTSDSPSAQGAAATPNWLGQRDHYENFPVASWLVPAHLRPAMFAVYRFARYGDDVADEGDARVEERLRELSRLRQALQGRQPHPIVDGLRPSIDKHRIDISLFEALLTAFETDARGTDYHSRDELLSYCKHSANPVGRIVLRIFDADQPAALAPSDSICTALQLINFAQDIGQDVSRGRCYVPQEELDSAELTIHDLESCVRARAITPQVRHLLDGQLEAAAVCLREGVPLLGHTRGRLRLELASIIAGGYAMLNKTKRFDPFSQRLKLGRSDFPAMLRQCFALLLNRPLR
ncbi:MAG: squalene synthase HpnC [Burkholderiaceae bacterium]